MISILAGGVVSGIVAGTTYGALYGLGAFVAGIIVGWAFVAFLVWISQR
jgi:hypothetical protein